MNSDLDVRRVDGEGGRHPVVVAVLNESSVGRESCRQRVDALTKDENHIFVNVYLLLEK